MKQHINSKSLLTLAIIISLLGINLIACGDKDEIEDEELIAVKNLNAPMNCTTICYRPIIRMVQKRNERC